MTIELATKPVPERRKANKAEVAEFFDVSIPAVDGWCRRGCPYIQRGQRGTQWIFDLRAVAEWYYKGTDVQLDDPEKMTPKDRLDWYRGARERTKHMEECGELIKASDYERALSNVLKVVAVGLESLPDVLERDTGIDGAAVELCQQRIDTLREELYQNVAKSS